MTMVYVALVLYMRHGWLSIPPFQVQNAPSTSVSVLIAARNEEDVIERTINALLNQDYPKELLEIIIIDDHSTDRTAEIVKTYGFKGVKLLQMNERDKLNSYKKKAIAKAIEIAQGEIIVTTDADCRMGKQWLSSVVSYFEEHGCYMVSSPVIYSEELNMFEEAQTLEFLYLIGLGAAGIGNGHPTTCNGANLAYRRDVFFEMEGFKGIDDLASGDDELLLHKVAEKYADKIGFCKSRSAIVYTDAKPNLFAFISQRKRWASKSTKYKNKSVIVLGVSIWLFNLAMLLSGILAFFYPTTLGTLIFGVIMVKFLVELYFMRPLCKFAERTNLLKYLPLLTIGHIVYLVYIGIAGNIGKYDWKGRIVK